MVVYYSGHSVPPEEADPAPNAQVDERRDAFWILHDTLQSGGKLVNGIAALELHDLIMTIPATHKTVILDTHANWSLVSHAENEGAYNLLLASDKPAGFTGQRVGIAGRPSRSIFTRFDAVTSE